MLNDIDRPDPAYVHDIDNPRPLVDYRLPDGRIVRVDDSAAKGAARITFGLPGGQHAIATRVRPYAP